jgi:hypothetical protein
MVPPSTSPCGARRKLVADALTRYLALELGKREQHVQREPTHRGGGGLELWVTDTNETPCASNSSTSLPHQAPSPRTITSKQYQHRLSEAGETVGTNDDQPLAID